MYFDEGTSFRSGGKYKFINYSLLISGKLKNMKKIAFLGMLTMGMVVLFASCAKVPQAAIDGAKSAVDSAKIAEAAVYVPEQLTALEDSLKSAEAEVETQKAKFFSNYDKASSTLAWVSANASQVAQNAVTRKAQLKEEIVAVIAEVTAALAEDKELVAKAPKGKEGKAALEAINSELSVVEATIAECQTAYDNGQYVGTIDKIKAAKDKAASIKEELTAAIDKTKKK